MNAPIVSIGLPVYNGGSYIRGALDSVLAQDFRELELVISDNGSNDETERICREYEKHDNRVRYYRQQVNRGAAWNYNHVFDLAQGRYFKWIAHDDECNPGFLTKCVGTLERAPKNVVMAYPRAEIMDAQGRTIGADSDCLSACEVRPHLRMATVLRNVSKANAVFGLIRSEFLRKTRLIDRFIASDYVLLCELALLGQIWEIPDVLSRRRLHHGMSAKPGEEWFKIWTITAKSKAMWDPLLAWFDSSHDRYRSCVSPFVLLGWQYGRSVKRLPLSKWEKALCFLTIGRVWYGQHLRNLAGLYKRRIKNFF